MADNTMVLANGDQAGQFSFLGTGGGLFATLLVGALLTVITLGIYYPWFIIKVAKFMLTNTESILGRSKFSYDFGGTGEQLFVKILVGLLLTVITFGIYYAWFIVSLINFKFQNLLVLDKA